MSDLKLQQQNFYLSITTENHGHIVRQLHGQLVDTVNTQPHGYMPENPQCFIHT